MWGLRGERRFVVYSSAMQCRWGRCEEGRWEEGSCEEGRGEEGRCEEGRGEEGRCRWQLSAM